MNSATKQNGSKSKKISNKSCEILKSALKRKQEKNPTFSLRAFAKHLEVSPSYVVSIFSGKKSFPEHRFEKICHLLEIDDISQKAFKEQLIRERLNANQESLAFFEQRFTEKSQANYQASPAHRFVELGESHFFILDKWYYLPLLDLSTCTGFTLDSKWISHRLNITDKQASEAISLLIAKGLLVNINGRWIKRVEKLRFPTTRSFTKIRYFHRLMIERALFNLESKISEEDFDSRSIQGITFAANPKKMKEAKEILVSALSKVEELMNSGDCTEVYQLNIQFFPMTKK